MPQYKQLARCWFKRARRGLFGGDRIRFGDQISEDGGNRTKRTWEPMVRRKRLFSDALQHMVRLRVTDTALRDIDAAGGLDKYLIQTPLGRLESDTAFQLRQRILAARRAQHSQQAVQQQGQQPATAEAAGQG